MTKDLKYYFKAARYKTGKFIYKHFKGIKPYQPRTLDEPQKMLNIASSWKGIERIIKDIIINSNCGTDKCLEFGVEFGYSIVALSNYFKQVVGVDTFTGDPHAGYHGDIYLSVKENLQQYRNIDLIQADYNDYIR